MRIEFEQYLKVFQFLNNKNKVDFENYKKKFYKNHKNYDDKKELNYLLEYYELEKSDENEAESIIENLSMIKKALTLFFVLIGFFITYISFDEEINLLVYLFVSIILPFSYLVYVAYRHFSYNFSTKKSKSSILNFYLKNKFKNFKFTKEFSYVIKTYSTMLFIRFAIFYEIGVLVATILIFSFSNVTFYSGTTYGVDDYQQVKNIQQLNETHKYTQYSSAFWSRIITYTLLVMIMLKGGLYFLAKRNNDKTIIQALFKQGEEFFDILKNNTYIGKSEENIKKENLDKENIKRENFDKGNIKKENIKKEDNTYFILYYQIEPEEQSKIAFKISNEESLKNKKFKRFSYKLFGKTEEDLDTLTKLYNLVIIYASPETIPDEQFKKNILTILEETNVNDIWIIPLIRDKDDKLRLMKKSDKDYIKWDRIISKINKINVRSYYDV